MFAAAIMEDGSRVEARPARKPRPALTGSRRQTFLPAGLTSAFVRPALFFRLTANAAGTGQR